MPQSQVNFFREGMHTGKREWPGTESRSCLVKGGQACRGQREPARKRSVTEVERSRSLRPRGF